MGSKIAITIGFLVVYFGLMVWAAFFSKTGKMENKGSIDEFAVGGRNFGWIIVLFTLMGLFVTASIYASWFTIRYFRSIFKCLFRIRFRFYLHLRQTHLGLG